MIGSRNEREGCGTHVGPKELVTAMEQEVQQYLQSMMQVVNDASDGEWISGSEESVRLLRFPSRVPSSEAAHIALFFATAAWNESVGLAHARDGYRSV